MEIRGDIMETKKVVSDSNQKPGKAKGSVTPGRIAAVALLTLILLYLAGARAFGLPAPFLEGNVSVMSLVRLALFVPILFLGREIYIRGFARLVKFNPNIESLATVATTLATATSFYSLIMIVISYEEYADRIHFEACAVIILFMMIGEYLEERMNKEKGSTADKLGELFPENVTVVRNHVEQTVSISEISVGDMILVQPGESFPCDGTVVSGRAGVDESLLTGEAIPVEKTSDDKVFAGTVCRSGFITIRAEALGSDTSLGRMISAARNAEAVKSTDSKVYTHLQRNERVYSLCSVGVAILTFFIWLMASKDFGRSLEAVERMLLTSCPCASLFAVPFAVNSAVSRGEREGIVYKSPSALEKIESVNTIVMDKTGVITVGKPFVTDVIPFGTDAATVVIIAASLESHSTHPIASAVLDYAKKNDIEPMDCDVFESVEGFGVKGVIEEDSVSVGRADAIFTGEFEGYAAICQPLTEQGKTIAAVTKNGSPIGVVAFQDKLKPTSKAGIERLARLGIRTIMVTGDSEGTGTSVAEEVEVYDRAENVTPSQKADMIRKLRYGGRTVAMIGDSSNDALALAAADVAISMKDASDVALEASEIILLKNDLRDASAAVRISSETKKTISSNFLFGMIFNAVTVPIMAFSPLFIQNSTVDAFICAVCLIVSTAAVLVNSVRIKKMDLTAAKD
ncbi:MAG: heavy metal translocating P-type ATPase [Oscillospiraceae bacterium]|nr:heavy metal translocating P-type ATPase [Oscillospiraceae bacterium]